MFDAPKEKGDFMDAASVGGIVLGMGALLLLGLVGYGVLVESRRMLRGDGRLRLTRMLVRHGVAPSAVANEYNEVARATRRCVACADKSRCDAWLASHRREGSGAFCPNAAFISRSARA
jgi:hypothetical protein